MSNPLRPTENSPQLTNAHTNPPTAGSNVFALTHGGVLVPLVWSTGAIKYFDAWMAYPKIPQEIKELQASRLK